jgi:DNA (cytosine-5)-methyltransferase 1
MRSSSYVDTSKTVTHLGLCAGYGGIELGLKRIFHALRTVAFCEIEGFAIANLVAKMEAGLLDAAPIWSDLKTFPWAEFSGKVDILTGGYPCQPFSAAGKRLGRSDPRHLWPWIADGIVSMRPRICFFENVEGHISLGLREVVEELERLGYKTTWGIFSASEVGAPHQRKRVFILAYRNDSGRGQDWLSGKFWPSVPEQSSGDCWFANALAQQQIWPSLPGEPQHQWEPPRVVGDAKSKQDGRIQLCGLQANAQSTDPSVGDTARQLLQRSVASGQQAGCAESANPGKRQAQPSMGGNADGAANRMDDAELFISCDNRTDELRLLGNGVVPATAEQAFLILAQQLELI